MRRKRGRTVDVEEGESYYVSMTDMMVGVIFIFIIMLSYFALEFRSTTTALTKAKHPETAALLQTAVGAPYMLRSEARAVQNLPYVDGTDELVTPLNVTTGGLASPRDTAPKHRPGPLPKPAGRPPS